MAWFRFEGQRLAYSADRASGSRGGRDPDTTVILPSLLLSQKMQLPLARALAREGNRVVTFDPLGHGLWARPLVVIGHDRDPIHPFSDAGMLASELPDARLVHARSVLELRIRPQRLTAEIGDFIADCWSRADALSAVA